MDNKKDLNGLIPGDIIYAKRFNNESEKSDIPEEHRNGRYIIHSIKDNKIYCFPEKFVSSRIKKRKHYYSLYSGHGY